MSEKLNKSIQNVENIEVSNETKTNSIWLYITILIFNISSIIYSIKNRTFDDILKYSAYIASITLLTIFLLALIFWYKSQFRKIDSQAIKILIFSPFFSVLVGFLQYCYSVSAKDLFIWLQTAILTEAGIIFLVVLTTLIFGLIFFYFRLKFRGIYGFTEIVLGLTIAANRVLEENEIPNESPEFYLAFISAAIYLVVRGLDNIHQGITKEPLDPVFSRIIKRFKKSN